MEYFSNLRDSIGGQRPCSIINSNVSLSKRKLPPFPAPRICFWLRGKLSYFESGNVFNCNPFTAREAVIYGLDGILKPVEGEIGSVTCPW